MRDAIIAVDESILVFFTKISHRFQVLTGKTNFFLAKCSWLVILAWVAAVIINYCFPIISGNTDVVDVMLSVVLLIFSVPLVNILDDAENGAQNGATTAKQKIQQANSIVWRIAVLSSCLCRMIALMMAVVFTKIPTSELFFFVIAPASVIFFYLISVDPLPPCKSKITEWIKEFFGSFRKQAFA